MSTKVLKKIQEKEMRRREFISLLLENKKMVKGSFCQIFVKCGKKNCWCVNGKGHSHWRMSLREQGKSFSRAVPIEEYEWIKEMTGNYRIFKKMRKQLVKLEKEIQILLDRYENACVNQSKKGKSYLDVASVVSDDKLKKRSEVKKSA